LALSCNDVHLWRASLEQPLPSISRLAATLSDDEHGRASRFRFERDRRRFIVGRGVLRTILGGYLSIEPGQLQLRYGRYGKPYVIQEPAGEDLRFNLAHAQDLALYAFTRGREIGIDLERVHPMPDADQIAARFFSARENAVYQALPSDQRQGAFFRCWTRKEAYIKALGEGLSRPLDQFDVSLAPGETARLLHVEGHPAETARWSFKALVPASGYEAALAVEGHDWQLACWHYG
jgi:4'-phosphopantetheinyl transferase